ncbi:MAG: CsgG/HfaB family protein [bacterium]
MMGFRRYERLIQFLLTLIMPVWCQAQDISVKPYSSLRMETKKNVTALAFSSDDKLLLSGDSKGNIQCWNLERKIPITSIKLKSEVIFLDFLDENNTIVGVDKSGNVTVFNLLTGNSVLSFKTKSKPSELAFDTGKRYLAIATENERVEIFDLKAGMPAGSIDARGKIDHLLFLGFNRLGEQLVAITERAKVVSWNPATQRLIREISLGSGEIHGSKSVIHCASTNRASNIFVVGLQEVALPKGGLRGRARPTDLIRQNMVLAYDWNSGIEIKRVKFPYGTVKKIALGPGNDHVAVINNKNKNITLIDLRKGELGVSVTMNENPKVLAISDDDTWLAAGTKNGQISVWELQFRARPTAETISSSLPTLSGRIRTQTNLGPALTPGVPVTLAILNFEAKGVSQSVADIGLDLLSSSLANFDYITLVERNKIKDVINELKLQLSGLTEENGAEVGKILNADMVLLCSVGALGSSYIFNARLIDVETARVVKGRQVNCEECRDQDLFDAINLLVSTIAQ